MITDEMPTRALEAGGDVNDDAAFTNILIAFLSLLVFLGLVSIALLVAIWSYGSRGMPRKRSGQTQNNNGDSSGQLMSFSELRRSRVFKESFCSICRRDYLNNESVKVMPCGHVFHPRCVEAWLCSKRSCPNCRGLI
ncbi:hypothetical protein L6164_029180 [Bauhinia variegata]|uniref:Uncharacterized protein n=1 Tax=Bauhinia variegata TaxID=167791 RepID=A0ACB9L8E7_BAUVA|nr:hypothetical protein L6164_029180 [Bauhinia variegata]